MCGRGAFTLLLAAALLFGIELTLRLCHYGYPTEYFVKSEGGRYYRENRQFGWQFFPHESAIIPNPVRFAAAKAPGTYRVFLLGESAAAGSPNQAFGFGRILQVMLHQQYPEKRFEIVNAAMRGVDSDIILRIARECARHQPDLFIIYMGNNEFVPLHTTDKNSSAWARSLRQNCLIQFVQATRLAQLAREGCERLRRSPGEVVWDMEFFRQRRLGSEAPGRVAVYNDFRANFARICDAVTGSGAPAIIGSVGVNLRDCPPLGSLHRPGLTEAEASAWQAYYSAGVEAETRQDFERAIQCYRAAAALDGQYAELRYRLAQVLLVAGELRQAAQHFAAARDCDALQFRADSRINGMIRAEIGARPTTRLRWVDVERSLTESPLSEHGIPGARLFYDHVHFRFDGDYEVAKTLFPSVVAALDLGIRSGQIPSRNRCAELLAFTPWDESKLEHLMLQLTGRPPFTGQIDHALRQAKAEQRWQERAQTIDLHGWNEALGIYRRAIAHDPNDWQLHYNFGFLLQHLGDFPGALEQFNRTLELFPRLLNVEVEIGATKLRAGQVDSAIEHLTEAVRMDPHYRRAWQLLAQASERGERQK